MPEDDTFGRGVFQGEILTRLRTIEAACERTNQFLQKFDDRLRVVEAEQETCVQVSRKSEDHEKRLREVEQGQTRLKAYATAMGAMAGFIGSFVRKWW